MSVTVIMVTRNRPDSLRKCLGQIRKVLHGATRIIVFDDASSESAVIRGIVESHGNTTYLRSEQVVGPGEGRNRCMREAETPFCLSLDDDCFLSAPLDISKWLEEHPADQDIAAISFKLYNVPESCYAPLHAEAGPMKSFHGGASLLRREAILKAGGYLDWLVYACEDTELALRLWRLGYRTWYDPSVVVHHDHVAAARDERWASFHYVRNTFILNVLDRGLIVGLPMGIARALRRGFHTTMPGQTARGILAGLRLLPFCLRESRRLFAPERRFVPAKP
jgi:GT2 family glycosyltransferase